MGVELMTFAIYFQVLFSLLLKQFHYCEDHSYSFINPKFTYMIFIYSQLFEQ